MNRIAELLILIPSLTKQVEALQETFKNNKETQAKRVNEFFQALLGLTADVLSVNLNSDSTVFYIKQGDDTHSCDFTIRHYSRMLRDNTPFQLSWLSTSGCTEDTLHYLIYVSALGKVGDDLMNAKTIKPFLLEEIEIHNAIIKPRNDKNSELSALKSELKRLQEAELINTIYQNNGIRMGEQFPDGFGVYDLIIKNNTLALRNLVVKKVTDKTVTIEVHTRWDSDSHEKRMKRSDADRLFLRLATAYKEKAEGLTEKA